MVTISIELPEYLGQWLVNAMGGREPVVFPKGSAFNSFLRVFLRNKRESDRVIIDSGSGVRIVVPHFPGKDPESYNYLPHNARESFVSLIRDSFDVELFTEMSSFPTATQKRKGAELLNLWMEAHGIDLTDRNTCAVLKRLQLLRRRSRDRERKRKRQRRTQTP